MIDNVIQFPKDGQVKRCGWRRLEKTDRRIDAWRPSEHLSQQCRLRRIPANVIGIAVELADLWQPGRNDCLRISLSRRAIRKAARLYQHEHCTRFLERLVIVLSMDGTVVTAWLEEHPRRLRRLPRTVTSAAAA